MKNRVLGMWRPETITATVGSETMEPFGPKPAGLLCLHESLHFVELISDPNVPRFASDAPRSWDSRRGQSLSDRKPRPVWHLQRRW